MAFGIDAGGVAGVDAQVVGAAVVGIGRLAPDDLPVDRLGVGVQEQLGRVAAAAGFGVVGPVDPVAVAAPGFHALEMAVPAVGVDLGQGVPVLPAFVEEAQLDCFGRLREDGEVGAETVEGGTQREGFAGDTAWTMGATYRSGPARLTLGRDRGRGLGAPKRAGDRGSSLPDQPHQKAVAMMQYRATRAVPSTQLYSPS